MSSKGLSIIFARILVGHHDNCIRQNVRLQSWYEGGTDEQ
jgi:hypothetical protein